MPMFWLGEVSEMEFELFATTLTDLIRLMSAAHLIHVFCRHLKELVISSRVTNVSISFMDINLIPWQIKDISEKNIICEFISVVWNHIVGQQLTCKFRIVWKKTELSYICDPVELSECKTSSRLSAALTALMLIAFIGFAEPSSGI